MLKSVPIDRAAQIGVALILFTFAVYFYHNRYGFIADPFGRALLWDAKVFMAGGLDMVQGGNPYLHFVWSDPFPLPFISPPAFTAALGVVTAALGANVFLPFALAHVAAMIIAPLLLSRLFLGRHWTDAVLGYGVFICGFGGWGVTTLIAGNFGSALYLVIFAALAYALKTNKWLPFHVAVACACQVKMPYALLWAVPVMLNGWDWRQLRHAAIAAAAAAVPYVVSYAAYPAFFHDWLAALGRQVTVGADVGFSVYGGLYVRTPIGSPAPMIGHVLVAAALFVFLLLDRTRGVRRLAALIVFALIANPRMKEYDMAFAAIPAAALYLAALAPAGASALRRACALGVLLLMMAFILKADATPIVGVFIYAVSFIGAILTLALKLPEPAGAPQAA